MNFSDFNFNQNILKAITEKGFERPTAIQAEAFKILLESEDDFVGQAQTGTGKTAAFVLPLLERLSQGKGAARALILSPTRELAKQIEQEINNFNKYISVNATLVYGGASYTDQINSIQRNKPSIIVGTPGRIIDLMNRGILKFEKTEFFILDEADEMLKMGFIDDVQLILSKVNESRKLWMFSATIPPRVLSLVKNIFKNPTYIKAKSNSISSDYIVQKYFVVERRMKFEALYRLIIADNAENGIIFSNTKLESMEIAEKLYQRGIKSACLNGDLSQSLREITMSKFKQGRIKFLVCTDVASRGIDVTGLTHVFNFGIPQDSDSYVHRIGRTGRAEQSGHAYTIVSENEVGMIKFIEKNINKKMERGTLPTLLETKTAIVKKEAVRLFPILHSIQAKGEDFQIDPSFEEFAAEFPKCTKEDLQKTIFTLMFNKEFRQLNDLGEFINIPERRGSSNSYGNNNSSRGRNNFNGYRGRRRNY